MDFKAFAIDNARAEFDSFFDISAEQTSRQITAVVRKTYPEVYWVGGIGWCGPEWDKARELESTLRLVKEVR